VSPTDTPRHIININTNITYGSSASERVWGANVYVPAYVRVSALSMP